MAFQPAHAGVRWSAAGALCEINDRRAVDPLIAALKDAEGHVRGWAGCALRDITGQSIVGDDPHKWEKWWRDNKDSKGNGSKQ